MGEEFVLTIRDPARVEGRAIGVSYDAFIDDVQARSQRRMLRAILMPEAAQPVAACMHCRGMQPSPAAG